MGRLDNPYPITQESEMRRFAGDPRFRRQMRVLDIIAGAFIAAGFVYVGIVAAGLLHGVQAEAASHSASVWQAVAVVAAIEPLALFVVVKLLVARHASLRGFMAACQQAAVLVVVSMAFGEAIVIFGLVTYILGAPLSVAYGLMGYGFAVLVVTYAILRPVAARLILSRLAWEEASRQ